MSRKLTLTLTVLCLCFLFVSCAGNENGSGSTEQLEEKNSTTESGVDVDLTALSSTMVYAEVFNIMVSPENYIGKTVKMRGSYYASYYEETGKYYHNVIIEDAAACCKQGIEFIWNGEHAYPEDYPADGTEVEVVGTFGTYEELGVSYSYISTDEIKIIE